LSLLAKFHHCLLITFQDAEALLAELKRDRQVRRHPHYALVSNEMARLPKFSIFEEWDSESSVKLVGEWTRTALPPITSPSLDVFNYKVVYSSTSTVADLERVNAALTEEIPRYLLLVDTAHSRNWVEELLSNTMAITHHLKQASLLLVDAPSRLPEGEQAVAAIHAQLQKLNEIDAQMSTAADVVLMVN
jgi:hypothetical protein